MSVNSPDLEALELQLLVEAIHRRYGFDFRDYAPASLRRRILGMVQAEKLATIGELQARLLHDPACMQRFLLSISVTTTSMFRDPGFYAALRTRVLPDLRAVPFLRIWDVGCSTGEEVYSLAILLREEGLYGRCRIYATDMNEGVLARAKSGIFPLAAMKEYTENYQKAGGTRDFSTYYTAGYDSAVFAPALTERVLFAQHNLVTDRSFNEFHLILCRNVLIYFNGALQDRVIDLLYASLAPAGYLGLGTRESLRFTTRENCFEEVDAPFRIYRRIQ